MQELIWTYQQVTTDGIITAIGCSHSLAYKIMHNHLNFWKVLHIGTPITDQGTQKDPNGSVPATSFSVH